MSDERFFSQVKSTLHGYAPEVPQAVYMGMRKKLWWSRFTRMDMSRFNMWYLLLLVGATGFASINYLADNSIAERPSPFVAPVFTVNTADLSNSGDVKAEPAEYVSCSGKSCCSDMGATSRLFSQESSADAKGKQNTINETVESEVLVAGNDLESMQNPEVAASEAKLTQITQEAISTDQSPVVPSKSKERKGLKATKYMDRNQNK